ncbi:hypothetical protein TNCV_2409611 [Trichonephila clavipes]|nr:hypothetical protein TNCV_2409611 [Trichonephila clavipes]
MEYNRPNCPMEIRKYIIAPPARICVSPGSYISNSLKFFRISSLNFSMLFIQVDLLNVFLVILAPRTGWWSLRLSEHITGQIAGLTFLQPSGSLDLSVRLRRTVEKSFIARLLDS